MYILVPAADRYNNCWKPMIQNLDPKESWAPMHYPINCLNFFIKFVANYNSWYAYEDETPRNRRGVAKGPEGKAAFEAERKEIREKAEKNLQMKIGQ